MSWKVKVNGEVVYTSCSYRSEIRYHKEVRKHPESKVELLDEHGKARMRHVAAKGKSALAGA